MQTSQIEPSVVINMMGKQTITICSKCKYKDTIYLAQSTLVNVFHRDPIANLNEERMTHI